MANTPEERPWWDAEKSFALGCPKCGSQSNLAITFSGKWVRCPKCRTKFRAPAPDAPPQTPPKKFGRYEVSDYLGGGGMADVYLAFDPELRRGVAVKIPRKVIQDDPNKLARFLAEGHRSSTLSHPHIVPVFDVGQDAGGVCYLAMGFVKGEGLDKVLERGRLEPRRAAEIAHALAGALAYAHRQGVIHQDVKPQNVMMDEAGRPSLIDFGLAYRVDQEKAAEGEARGRAYPGTPVYMSPEATEGSVPCPTPFFDQYSLGVTLYALLVGRAPFAGASLDIIRYHVVHTAPDPLGKHRDDVPPDLEAICHKAMAKKAEDRYPSCAEMAEDLRRFLAGEEVRARPQGRMERLARWARREPVLAWMSAVAAAAVLLAAVFGVMFGLTQQKAAALARQGEDTAIKAEAATIKAEADAVAAEKRVRAARDLAVKNEQDAIRNGQEARRQGALQLFDRARGLAVQDEAGQAMLLLADGVRLAGEAGPAGRPLERLFRANLAGWRQEVHTLTHAGLVGGFAAAPPLALAFGPDGLLAAEHGLHVRPYDGSLKPGVREPLHHACHAATLSADGSILAAIHEGAQKAFVWARGPVMWRPAAEAGVPGKVSAVALSPDGTRLLAGNEAGEVFVVPLSDGQPGKPLRLGDARPGKPVSVVAAGPGRLLAVCNLTAGKLVVGAEYRLWAEDGTPLKGPAPGRFGVHAAAFSPDGKQLAAACGSRYQGEALLWQVGGAGTQPLATMPHQAEVFAVAFAPGGAMLATAGQDRAARLWDARTGRAVGHPLHHPRDVRRVLFTPDDAALITVSDDAEGAVLRRWQIASGTVPDHTHLLPVAFPSPVRSAAASRDGRTVLVGGFRFDQGGFATLLGPQLERLLDLPLREGKSTDPVVSVALDADAARALVGQQSADEQSGQATLWDREGKRLATLDHEAAVSCVALSADGRRAATGGVDGVVRLWPAAAAGGRAPVKYDTGKAVLCVAFSPDGKEVLAGGRDARTHVLDAATGRAIRKWSHPDVVMSCAFKRDAKDRHHVLIGYAGGARMWDWAPETPKELAPPLRHQTGVVSVALSESGEEALTAGTDGMVWRWDQATQRPLGPPMTHQGVAVAAVFGAGGSVVTATPGGRLHGRVCRWRYPTTPEADARHLSRWASSLNGLTLDGGGVRQLSRKEWQALADHVKADLPAADLQARGTPWRADALERPIPPERPRPVAAEGDRPAPPPDKKGPPIEKKGPEDKKDPPIDKKGPITPSDKPPPPFTGLKEVLAGTSGLLIDDAEAVLSVNFRALSASDLLSKGAAADLLTNAMKNLADTLGMDPRKDLHGLVVSMADLSGGERRKSRVVLRGDFDLEKMGAALRKADNVTATKEGKIDLFEVKSQDRPLFGVFLGKTAFVLTESKEATLTLARDGLPKSSKQGKPMLAALKRFTGKESAAAAVLINDEMRKQAGANPSLAAAVKDLNTVTLSVTVASDVDVAVVGQTADGQAKKLATQLAGLKALGDAAVGMMENIPQEAKDLFEAIKIDNTRDTVSITLKVSKDTIEKAARKAGG